MLKQAVALAIALTAFCGAGRADTYPTRPVTLVVPFPAGGATDALARTLAQRMTQGLGRTVLVDNRAGAGGLLGSAVVANAAPDGYTVLVATTSTHVILPLTQARPGYDPLKSFTPIGMVATAPNVLIASPKLAANSVAELISLAKAKPASLNFASSGQGSVTHLIAEKFKLEAGIDVVHIPYKGGVQSVPDLTEGSVAYLFDSIVWSLPLIRAGKLKGLAVTSRTRSTLAPDIPTVAESGLPGFEGITWFALAAPAGTPEPAVARLRTELDAALRDPAIAAKFAGFGAEPAPGSPDDLIRVIREDTVRWETVIRKAGIQKQ